MPLWRIKKLNEQVSVCGGRGWGSGWGVGGGGEI